MNRRILFIAIAACIGAGSSARASATKVGNGDDGADLEALTPVKSGPIENRPSDETRLEGEREAA